MVNSQSLRVCLVEWILGRMKKKKKKKKKKTITTNKSWIKTMHVTYYCSKGGGAHLIFCQDFNVLHVTASVS